MKRHAHGEGFVSVRPLGANVGLPPRSGQSLTATCSKGKRDAEEGCRLPI